ncbi:hypothetical protein CU098_008455 [Rhizopus stolonifer]|uniref:Post-GPI attachment to proteins factor 3 n=1 Tax=Rhizopus stolonifer TaxID=4846 RepID=A0A367JI02_RHIST|nr:hypothetical protein CU098_008455 [Rhizopus stolonifer]
MRRNLLSDRVTLASSGDYQPQYRACVDQCASSAHTLPLNLRLLGWSVLDDCKYTCMQTITQTAIETGDRIHQYHGKWPFYRIYGIQEIASVIFSILNGLFHYKYFFQLLEIPSGFKHKNVYLGTSLCGMNAWLWSTVFHTRDLPWTEKLDYFSAGLYILYGLFLAVVRIFNPKGIWFKLWAGVCGAAYLVHVSYLSRLTRFDYGYNMLACLIVGGIQTSIWLVWSIMNLRRRSYAWMSGVSVVLVGLAMSLEVFDFPPWLGLLDAHSLWHAATIPLAPLFYHFLLKDAYTECSGKKLDKQLW